MNRQEILSMEAGRELDGLIAEHIFGYKWGKTPKDCNGEHGGEDILIPPGVDENWEYPPMGRISKYYHVAHKYSTEIEDAWRVVRKLTIQGHFVNVCQFPFKDTGNTHIQRVKDTFTGELDVPVQLQDKTVPLSICKAALLAKLEG